MKTLLKNEKRFKKQTFIIYFFVNILAAYFNSTGLNEQLKVISGFNRPDTEYPANEIMELVYFFECRKKEFNAVRRKRVETVHIYSTG